MTSRYWSTSALFAAALASAALAQAPGVLTVAEPQKLTVPRAGEASQTLKLSMRPGFHANSNTPTEDYLIPLKLTWEPGAVDVAAINYPVPKMESFSFTDKPISVFDGDFEIVTKFKRSPKAQPGPAILSGKLRYQACDDKMCLPPKTIEIKVPLLVQ